MQHTLLKSYTIVFSNTLILHTHTRYQLNETVHIILVKVLYFNMQVIYLLYNIIQQLTLISQRR